jgi:hypothetical protein
MGRKVKPVSPAGFCKDGYEISSEQIIGLQPEQRAFSQNETF